MKAEKGEAQCSPARCLASGLEKLQIALCASSWLVGFRRSVGPGWWLEPGLKGAKVKTFSLEYHCSYMSSVGWVISFEVSGLQTKTHLLQRHFIFLTYFNSRLFLSSTCTIRSHIINFQPFLTPFAIFHAFNDFFWAKWLWNWKALQMNSDQVESWHVIIISPT